MTRTKRSPNGVTIALVLASAGAALVATAEAQGGGFTTEERRRLLEGELVTRDVTRRDGRSELFGGTSWMRVRAPIDDVWRTVRDPAAYPQLIPSLSRVRVVEERDAERVLHMQHELTIASTSYYVRMRVNDAAHEIRFELDRSRPHDVRAGRGFISLSRYRGDTIVSWGMLADVGAGMLQDVFGPFLNQWLLLPPRCVRDVVEPGREPSCG